MVSASTANGNESWSNVDSMKDRVRINRSLYDYTCVQEVEESISEEDVVDDGRNIRERSAGCVLMYRKDNTDNDVGLVLLIERSNRGSYEIPKGHVEDFDKSLRECAERELREETGLSSSIRIEEILGIDGYEVTKKGSRRNSKKRVKDADGRSWKCVTYFRAVATSPIRFDQSLCETSTTHCRWISADEYASGRVDIRVPRTAQWIQSGLVGSDIVVSSPALAIQSLRSHPDVFAVGRATKTIVHILRHAIDNTNDGQYRTLSIFNRSLIIRVLSVAGGLNVLRSAGYREDKTRACLVWKPGQNGGYAPALRCISLLLHDKDKEDNDDAPTEG